MTKPPTTTDDRHRPATYELRLKGHLDKRWGEQLGVPDLTHESDGTTILRGISADQPALHGLLQRLRDLGLTLVSLVCIGSPPPGSTDPAPSPRSKDTKMKTTISGPIRWSGLAAAMAGLSYVLVGAVHPPNEFLAVTSPAWLASHIFAMAMSILGLFGLTGLYARQAEKSGWLGLAGYALLSLWLALVLGFTFVEVLVLPALVSVAPAFVNGWLGMFNGTASEIDLGALATLWTLTGPLYILGGLMFGIATFRAHVLPRWAGALLAVGTAAGPLAALVPLDLQPKVAVPVGIALIWLGYSLWSERREAATSLTGGSSISLRHQAVP